MIVFILTAFSLFIFSLANWEAELIKRSESNHLYKSLLLACIFWLMALMWLEGVKGWKYMLIDIVACICLYFAMFDYILNIARKVPDPFNYKLFGKPWMKALSLMGIIGLITIYFLL